MSNRFARILLGLVGLWAGQAWGAAMLESAGGLATNAPTAPTTPAFEVRRYEVHGYTLPSNDGLMASLAKHTGTNLSLADIVEAASALQAEYANQGRTNVSVSVAAAAITNGVVALHVFRGGIPTILISGKPYSSANRAIAATSAKPAAPPKPSPPFTIRAYEITGDTLLTTEALTSVLAKNIGTNLTVTNIFRAQADLQMEYRERGYPTVKVFVPEQQISTNGIVKMRVFEGRLSDIDVMHNRHFSSNNVMRALPSLHTNLILVGPVFQAELDRANANQDRQIWPQIEPGSAEGTSRLTLDVKDRLPLHGRVEIDNQNTPGTPDLRINSSAVYQNLWQLEHSVGVQYGFSPEAFKQGDQWRLYDAPLVANYSIFYRLPLGSPDAISQEVAAQSGQFGYDEATRKFQLPPSSGRPELNFYASRSTIDTGLMTLTNYFVTRTPGEALQKKEVQQDLTVNESAGFRLSQPLAENNGLHSIFSGGGDVKSYGFTSFQTNIFTSSTYPVDPVTHQPIGTNSSSTATPTPTTYRSLDYVPITLRYDGSFADVRGTMRFGLGLGANLWYSGSLQEFQAITSSTNSSGHWITLNPSLSRDFTIWTNWTLSLRADGQWSNEPLISNEQYGLGGLNTVRGYHEGEVFGDTGWHVSLEQGTPPYVVGRVYGKNALTVRGTVYMDYGEAYLLDPQGREGRLPLWGAGFGAIGNVGSRWEARFLFSWPLLSTERTAANSPRFDFSLSAQF